MITHVVIFTWLATATDTQINHLHVALDHMAGELASFVTISHGPDLKLRDGNGDYALVARFATTDDWHRYQADPQHKHVVETYIAPIQAARLTIQFESADQ